MEDRYFKGWKDQQINHIWKIVLLPSKTVFPPISVTQIARNKIDAKVKK